MKPESISGTAAILVVDDDNGIADLLSEMLAARGTQIHRSATGQDALVQIQNQPFDLLILDLMLPDVDGLVICSRLRERSDAPILVCSGTQRKRDQVLALKLGADDFISKPFDVHELEARIQNLLRRGHQRSENANQRTAETLRLGILSVDRAGRRTTVKDEVVALTPTEYRLLVALLSDAGAVHSREELSLKVWGYHDASDGRTIDVHMRRLRGKLDKGHPDAPQILSVRGFGYQIVAEPDRQGLHIIA